MVQPAKVWEETLPLETAGWEQWFMAIRGGGDTATRKPFGRITPPERQSKNASGALREVQEMIFRKAYGEADKRINETFFGGPHGMPYQTAGSLILQFEGHSNWQEYYRELDLEKAVATTRYKVNGVTYKRELFSSFADDVIVLRLTADKKNSISFEAVYRNPAQHTITKRDDRLVLRGVGIDHEGVEGKSNMRYRH